MANSVHCTARVAAKIALQSVSLTQRNRHPIEWQSNLSPVTPRWNELRKLMRTIEHNLTLHLASMRLIALFWITLVSSTSLLVSSVCATDHILTIGGGYAPEGNQASLEANVIFFQRLLTTKHTKTPFTHRIQFADGFDPGSDLQIVLKRDANQPTAISMLQEIFAPPGPPGVIPGSQQVAYRNHRVPSISGSNRINDVRMAMDVLRSQVRSGDRLLVYVTAHGGSAKKGGDNHETSITCWGNRDLNMSELSKWLDTLPKEVPVVLVMAQCYCGGFAHTLFKDGQVDSGLPANVRTGFFAQRHDLPAAGCRPDVENDEEYSSYFWGAMLGQMRSGKQVLEADVDKSGKISLAEAHAYAVVASETIDIPLRGSDALLRSASRIPQYDLEDSETLSLDAVEEFDLAVSKNLMSMSGSLQSFAERASAIDRSILTGLCSRLKLELNAEVTTVFTEYADAAQEYRTARRGSFPRRGRGGFSRRRELRDAIIQQWPELEQQDNWANLDMLKGEAGDKFAKELKALPGYEGYIASRDERLKARGETFEAEMRQVRLRRLIHTLESIALAENLKRVGEPEMIERYQELIKLESSLFE